MRKTASIVMAAALSVGTIAWAQDTNKPESTAGQQAQSAAQQAGDSAKQAGDSAQNAANKTGEAVGNAADRATNAEGNAADKANEAAGNAANTAGTELGNSKDAEGVRWTFKTITQAAMTKNGFDDVVKRLVDADRDRIDKNKPSDEDLQKLDGIVAQIQKDWQDKYHQEFKMEDPKAIYNDQFASIESGTIGDNAQLAAAQEANSTDPNAKASDKNLEKDREAAIVNVAAANDQPALKVPMIREAGVTGHWWEINAPDSLDAQTLQANLEKQLTEVKDSKDQWPADVNDAYRIVTQHVLEAVMNQNGDNSSSGAAGNANTAQPAPAPTPAQ